MTEKTENRETTAENGDEQNGHTRQLRQRNNVKPETNSCHCCPNRKPQPSNRYRTTRMRERKGKDGEEGERRERGREGRGTRKGEKEEKPKGKIKNNN